MQKDGHFVSVDSKSTLTKTEVVRHLRTRDPWSDVYAKGMKEEKKIN